MSKKDKIDMGDLLNREGFGSEEKILASASASQGVSSAKQVSVTIDEIQFFKYNPRTVENPKYAEIKESIREIGLEQPLTITKRPGEAGYTLYNGGNTRLKILKELYKETNEDKFYFIDCRFMPFTSDSEIMIKHMIENEARGDMLLVDKAKAAYRIKQLHEHETGETLSLRKLADLMGKRGWKVSFVMVGIFIFIAENLNDKIPIALGAGLGKPKVVQIRKTYNAIKDYLVTKLPELNIEEIQSLYLDNLAKYDSEDGIDDYPLIDTCQYLSKLSAIEAPRIRMELEHIMTHGKVYDEPSLSKDFDKDGRRLQPSVPTEGMTAAESGEVETSTAESESSPLEQTNKVEENSHSMTPKITNSDEAQKQNISNKKQRKQEVAYQAANKLKMLLMQHQVLSKYVLPDNEFPFFTSMDVYMLTLHADMNTESDNWSYITKTAVCEMIKLLTAYFYSKVSACEEENSPKETYEIEREALNICQNKLLEQCKASELYISTIYFGFAQLDDEDKAILQVREEFSGFAKLLREHIALEMSDG